MSDTGSTEDNQLRYDQHGVFFSTESAPDSWSGHLSDELTISEAQIYDYVKYGNRRLFEKLQGMPFKSSDIPCSYQGHKSPRKVASVVDVHHVKSIEMRDYEEVSKPTETDVGFSCIDVELQDESHLKEVIQSSLLDGDVFTLKRLPADSLSLKCHYPKCIHSGKIQAQTLYLELDHSSSATDNFLELPTLILFHLNCLDYIFGTQRQHQLLYGPTDLSTSLDGVDRETVIEAASRLRTYNATADQAPGTPTGSDFAWKHPFNSEEAFELRSQKDRDIEEVLREVAKYKRSEANNTQESRGSSPDLLITPPVYMEPAAERYKKQGLSRYDQSLFNQERAELRKVSGLSSAADNERALANSVDLRYCYCLEPDDGQSDMIRCSSTWCTIGWFHLRCTDLSRLPIIGEKFYCEYCRDDFGPFKPMHTQSCEEKDTNSACNTSTIESESDHDQMTTDDWDDSEEDLDTNIEESEEPTLVMQSVVASWGTPINSPEGRRLEAERWICQPLSPTRPHKRSRLD